MVLWYRLILLASMILGFLFSTHSAYAADALRLFVPPFLGEKPLNQHVRTTIYFELVKSFRQFGPVQKGGWIIYGLDDLREPSHDAAISAGSLPSVSANLAIWGQAHRYGDGVIVQLFLTVLPPRNKQERRPEVWTIPSLKRDSHSKEIELDLPGRFYEFEPMILSPDVVLKFENPEGIPLYRERTGGEPIGFLGKLMYFLEIRNDAIKIESERGEVGHIGIPEQGWIRTEDLSGGESESIPFAKGMVRLLRGDWRGSRKSFSEVLQQKNIPQNLRIHALIYSGLTKEKQGESGLSEFVQAYRLNRLDKTAASFLLMSRTVQIRRAHQHNPELLGQRIHELQKDLQSVKVLFPKNDAWLQDIESYTRLKE